VSYAGQFGDGVITDNAVTGRFTGLL